MITPRQILLVAALCGMVAPASRSIDKVFFGPSGNQDAVIAVIAPDATLAHVDAAITGSLGDAKASADISDIDLLFAQPRRLFSAFPSKPDDDEILPPVRPLELSQECLEAETCVDEYLWSLYERTPKVDTNKVVTKIKKAVKKDGKIRTILASITNYVVGDFTWKDPSAAEKVNMPLKDYVIGGMDPSFRLKLFRALRKVEAAGFVPGITSAFRDDYRQGIALGNKAASDSSYHGGSRRGGFGRGLAADIVSVRGENRTQRLASSDAMWKWIDANEKDLGIGRPYRDRDPPHVGPLDGKEYAEKRGLANARAAAKAKAPKPAAKTATRTAKTEPKKPGTIAHLSTTRSARVDKSAKVSSLQASAADR